MWFDQLNAARGPEAREGAQRQAAPEADEVEGRETRPETRHPEGGERGAEAREPADAEARAQGHLAPGPNVIDSRFKKIGFHNYSVYTQA